MQILEGELLLQVCFEMNLLSDHLNSSNKKTIVNILVIQW